MLVWLLVCGLAARAAEPFDVVARSQTGNTVTWRIDRPNVSRRSTPYPNIRFQAGDTVTIAAGGCVQTGGSGRTWKRYVDPQGPNSDRLYHALINIPGVTPGTVRVAGWINRPLRIPAGIDPQRLFLTLGYIDDNYGDNGYHDHDNGTGDQCKGVGAAWVTITIGPGDRLPTAAAFDLVWDALDDNALPKNPKWGWQITHPGSFPDSELCFKLPGTFDNPQCTKQKPQIDTPHGVNDVLCRLHAEHPINGHVNFGDATYEGRIEWDGHSDDDDYNFKLTPPNQEGLTAANAGRLALEFDSDETIDYFQTSWWNAFHQAVDRGDSNPSLINGMYAIVTGLVGLDCEHDCKTELHPVYAMAIHVKDDPSDDVWAIFVRNWGNEGFCSQFRHYLPDNLRSFTIRLPWRPGASSVSARAGTQFLTNSNQLSGPNLTPLPSQGLLVTFTLPSPDTGPRVNGELHLQWPGGQAQAMHPLAAQKVAVRKAQPATPRNAEDRLAALRTSMTPAQRQIHQAKAQKSLGISRDAIAPRPAAAAVARVTPPAQQAELPRGRAVPDPDKAKRDQARMEALCAAFGGNVPEYPSLCLSRPAK
jgi:hypothetical protein